MDTPEVTDITLPIQLLRNYRETGCLLEIKTRWRY
jgi:hypothetical protein